MGENLDLDLDLEKINKTRTFFSAFGSRMASFKKARDELLSSICEEIINEDEFFFLYDINKSKSPAYPYWNYERFQLQDKSEADRLSCRTDFRFEKYEIPLLVEVLGLPDEIKCKQGTVCVSTEGLCIVLERLAYPFRQHFRQTCP